MKTLFIILGILVVFFIVVTIPIPKRLWSVKIFPGIVLLLCLILFTQVIRCLCFFIEALAILKWKTIYFLTEQVSIRKLEKEANKRLIRFQNKPSFYGKRDLKYLENLCCLMIQIYQVAPDVKAIPYRNTKDYQFLSAEKNIEEKRQYWSKALEEVKRQAEKNENDSRLCWNNFVKALFAGTVFSKVIKA